MIPKILDLRASLMTRSRVSLADLPKRHEIMRDERELDHYVVGPRNVPDNRRCAVRQYELAHQSTINRPLNVQYESVQSIPQPFFVSATVQQIVAPSEPTGTTKARVSYIARSEKRQVVYLRHVAHEVEREEVDPLHDVHRLFFFT